MPAIRRTLKNVVKNYSDAQVKVREATSNDPWGPSSTLMSEISDLTYNVVAFTEIMQMVWKRLNDDGKNWRHVYKSLVVLDYIIKTGSEKVASQCKENFHAIKTLASFQYIDVDNKDQGMNVREKAKQLVAMLSDDEKLKNERTKALKAKERFAQNAMGVGSRSSGVKPRMNLRESPTHRSAYTDSPGYNDSSPGSCSAGTPSEIENARPSSAGEEELQLQLALAMSKEEHDESVRKQKSDDIKLQMAIEQSKEQAKTPGGTLLDMAGPSSSAGAQAVATDAWGAPLPSQPASTDPWGALLPPHAPNPDPWGTSGGSRADPPPAYSPTMDGSASVAAPPTQPKADPWGMPNAAPASQTGAWASTSPTPPQTSWGGSSGFAPTSGGFDAFGAPTTNGASSSNNIDNEFDLLSARSTESSPVKSTSGLEEFDTLAGGTQANGSNDAWKMDDLKDGLHDGRKKDAKDFLGANANLVNLDQLVSKAPPKGNNPFAMMTETSNPFQDPNANVRRPMAQMQPAIQNQGFSQPVGTSLLPAPLIPMGSNAPVPQQPPPPQQSYNPFL